MIMASHSAHLLTGPEPMHGDYTLLVVTNMMSLWYHFFYVVSSKGYVMVCRTVGFLVTSALYAPVAQQLSVNSIK